MAETLSTISTVAFVLAAVLLILAIILWFYFRIPKIIGDLSGRTARKSIEKMRAHNERSGNKGYRPSTVNAKRGKLTDTMPDSKKLKAENLRPDDELDPAKPQPVTSTMVETGLLQNNRVALHDSVQTEQLDSATTLLPPDPNETELLSSTPAPPALQGNYVPLKMLDEVILIHTQEVI